MKADDLYVKITNDIIAKIEAGAGTWQMPWTRLAKHLAPLSVDGHNYRGINTLILAYTAADKGWSSGTWGTYKAWAAHGCQVRKGEKATHVFLWKSWTPKDGPKTDDGKDVKRLVARTFAVFSAHQCDGELAAAACDTADLPGLTITNLELSDMFGNIGADVRHGGDRAFYDWSTDHIQMPLVAQFHHEHDWFSTLAHEHVHWTGHKDRLGRDLHNRFGDQAYAMEELIAELGAAMFLAQLGLESTERIDHAQYIAHWLGVLKQDPKAIVSVASKAQQAVDLLLGLAATRVEPDFSEPAHDAGCACSECDPDPELRMELMKEARWVA